MVKKSNQRKPKSPGLVTSKRKPRLKAAVDAAAQSQEQEEGAAVNMEMDVTSSSLKKARKKHAKVLVNQFEAFNHCKI